MPDAPKCPECGRRPSERVGEVWGEHTGTCPHPIHDEADAGPEAVALLWKLKARGLAVDHSGIWQLVGEVDEFLARLPEREEGAG